MTNDPVISALQDQVGCYQRLAKLAEIQHDHVQQSRTEDLLDVLGRRQQVLDEVSRLERVISPAKKRWVQYVGELEIDQRSQAEGLLAETRRLLEQITAADRNDALVLQQRKLNLGRQLNQATSARQMNRNIAASAYGSRGPKLDLQQ